MASNKQYELFFRRFSQSLGHGNTYEAEFKAFCYSGGEVYWEIRSILLPVYETGSPDNFRVCKFISSGMPRWRPIFDQLGAAFGVLPSQNAAKHWGVEYLTNPLVRSEFTISTRALCGLGAYLCAGACRKVHKDRWAAAMMLFFQHLGLHYIAVRQKFLILLRETSHECDQIHDGAADCIHGQTIRGSLPVDEDWSAFFFAWQSCVLALDSCASCRSTTYRMAAYLEERINAHCHEQSRPRSDHKLTHKERLLCGKKRLRIDEDLKSAFTIDKLQKRQGGNPFSMIRGSEQDINDKSGQYWVEQHVLTCQALGFQTFAQTHVSHLAADASRIGCPAEECFVFFLWDTLANKGMPLAPQVNTLYWLMVSI